MPHIIEENLTTSKSQIIELYQKGAKPKSDFKAGIEAEKLPVNCETFKAVSYFGKNGVLEFLKRYKEEYNWKYIIQDGKITGLVNETGTVTLEPGSQLEYSINPQKTIAETAFLLKKFNDSIEKTGKEFNITWLEYGIQPFSSFKDIDVIPKKRYAYMTDYLPSKASMPLVMMRETAGIQLAFDYESEKDAMRKMRISLMLSPFMTAMFANSPIKNNKDTGYKSYRALAWLNTDNDRTGLISRESFRQGASFEDYVNAVSDIPMIFLHRGDNYYETGNLTFGGFIKSGFEGYRADINDWLNHASLFFPDVRLKNYIEIRNHDCVNYDLTLACIALWKGIMYNNKALEDVEELLKDYTYYDISLLRTLVPKYALDAEIKGIKISQSAKEIVKISKKSLKEEAVYIEPLEKLVSSGKSPADVMLGNWDEEKGFKSQRAYR